MNVDTVFGTLSLPDLAVAGAEDCFASAVRFAAKELESTLRKLPVLLQPSARLLARYWLGDHPSGAYLRDLELGQLAAMASWQSMPWAAGVSQDLIHQTYDLFSEASRSMRSDFARARRMADQGQCEPLTERVAERWANKFATRTATMGQYRKQTGCKCPNPMQCQCMVKVGP